MMKTLTLEEMKAVSGGWTISENRMFELEVETLYLMMKLYTLKEIQDKICNTEEERKYVKLFYESL